MAIPPSPATVNAHSGPSPSMTTPGDGRCGSATDQERRAMQTDGLSPGPRGDQFTDHVHGGGQHRRHKHAGRKEGEE
jgi:hypothetical protein